MSVSRSEQKQRVAAQLANARAKRAAAMKRRKSKGVRRQRPEQPSRKATRLLRSKMDAKRKKEKALKRARKTAKRVKPKIAADIEKIGRMGRRAGIEQAQKATARKRILRKKARRPPASMTAAECKKALGKANLLKMTNKVLKDMAKSMGLTGYSKKKKVDLVKMIDEASRN